LLKKASEVFISITGSAGTGKTLLAYDIAKEAMDNGSRVVVLHCGQLNSGQYLLINDYDWAIHPIKWVDRVEKFDDYDLVLIDEVQRIYPKQLDSIIKNVQKAKIACVFSYDKKQCLRDGEIINNIPGKIEEETHSRKYELTEKIRTNKEIAYFITQLFDSTKNIPNQSYPNVKLSYFADEERGLKLMLNHLYENKWKIINYTPSTYKIYPYEHYGFSNSSDSAHSVIGQEFDNVVGIIDKNFYYNKGQLSIKGYSEYYSQKQMLFQILTRTRERLHIIIINNEELLSRCLKILGDSAGNISIE